MQLESARLDENFKFEIIVNSNVIKEGVPGIEGTGFFGNDWSLEKGDFAWRR